MNSSTEAVLVVIYEAMAQVLWNFLVAQSMWIPTMTIYHGNKNIILLAENGKISSSR